MIETVLAVIETVLAVTESVLAVIETVLAAIETVLSGSWRSMMCQYISPPPWLVVQGVLISPYLINARKCLVLFERKKSLYFYINNLGRLGRSDPPDDRHFNVGAQAGPG